MAWRSHGTTNETLIDSLRRNNLITSPLVATAMLSTDRAHFCPTDPYRDSPQPIGHAATISAPHMHANAAEALLPYLKPGARVLDVGSGSGYLTCVLAALVMPEGVVVGVEHIEALRELGEGNARKGVESRGWVDEGRVRFVLGDGRRGWREGGEGWDAIHVGAAAAGFQQEFVNQLKAPGRLFIPIEEKSESSGHPEQHIYIIDKDEHGNVTTKKEYGVRYVPLTDAPAK